MKRDHFRILLPLAALLLWTGCDTLGGSESTDGARRSVIVANQGNFTDGNGSVTVYDPASGIGEASAISSLGTIIQSVTLVGDRLYVMSNSGGRIDVLDAGTFERVGQITDVVSPRYMVVDGTTGYVTSLYGEPDSLMGGLVTVVDLSAASKVTEIPVGNNPEGLALVGTRLYAANHGFGSGTTVSVIDTEANAVVDAIDVECDGPRFLAADAEDDVFVFCTGRTFYDEEGSVIGETDGAVRVLDGATGEIIGRIAIDGRIDTVGPGQDAFNAVEARLVFAVKNQETLLVFDTVVNSLVEEVGPFDGQPIGAVGYDPETDRLYVGRSNGFTQAGEVSLHERSGTEVGRFAAGIVPTYIVFRSEEG